MNHEVVQQNRTIFNLACCRECVEGKMKIIQRQEIASLRLSSHHSSEKVNVTLSNENTLKLLVIRYKVKS